ncbi:MAG TPA: M20/M25/M40 family metallo-hydrolase [Bacteroidales bacterium]|nr:M20/M25/M40 family metallo-hydrolase [Bacteroidales bacterium]
MRKMIFFLLLFELPFFVFGQHSIENIQVDTISLKTHVQYLSSKKCSGRGVGSPGLDSAARYIVSHFQSYGLESVPAGDNDETFYEPFNLYRFYNDEENTFIRFGNNELELYRNFHISAIDQTTKAETAEVVFGYDEDNESQCNIAGKFVAISTDRGWVEEEHLIKEIREHGAKGVIKILSDNGELSSDKVALMREVLYELNSMSYFLDFESSEFFTFRMPMVSVAQLFGYRENAFKRDFNRYKKGRKSRLNERTNTFTYSLPRISDTVGVKNVIGIIPGTDLKEEIVVLSAHYDHLGKSTHGYFPGADDNASGVAVLLETARSCGELSKIGVKPRRTIVFASFTAEEQGLLGSQYLLEKDTLIDINRIVANINVDMVGRGSAYHPQAPYQLYVYGNEFNTSLLELPDSINQSHAYLSLDYQYTQEDPNNYFEKSDQFSFIKQEIPAIFFFGGTHKDLHTPKDTYDKINFNRLEKVAMLTFYTLWTAANIGEL